MKKIVLISILLIIGLFTLSAETRGVNMIASPGSSSKKSTLDDMQLNQEVTIDDWGIIKITEAKVSDSFDYYLKGYKYTGSSGNEADYYEIYVDILNLQKTKVNFLEKYSVTAYFGDGYVFSGFADQYDWNKSKTVNVQAENRFAIDPLYYGHYRFSVTLPNFVIKESKPLKIVVKMNDVEFTYYVRK